MPASVGAWLRAMLPQAGEDELAALVTDGRLCTSGGVPVALTDPVIPGEFYWFHRPVPGERRVPFEIGIVHEDEELLVVDKPHFLASTPNGRFVRECAVTRLRVERGEPDLVAIHRLDRVTAGLLVLSRRRSTRGTYQRLFQDRAITKTYRALAELPDEQASASGAGRASAAGSAPEQARALEPGRPFEYASRLAKTSGDRQVKEEPGPPNARTRIELLRVLEHEGRRIGEFDLRPHTGRTHQLRVHMNALGMPILGDPVYPVDTDAESDDYSSPLQLLAAELAFTDPLTGEQRSFRSRLMLDPSRV